MPPRRDYSAEKRALLEQAATAAVPKAMPLPPMSTKPTMPGASQEDVDEKAWPDSDVGFVHQGDGQMYMTAERGYSPQHKLPDSVTNDDGTFTRGEESAPYSTRPKVEGKQLALGKAGSFQPSDPALHIMRQQNPHLNDYRFDIRPNPRGYHQIQAVHVPTNSSAGSLSWKSKEMVEHDGQPERAGEVDMIEVKDQHRARGLSTAMWDYAHFHAGRDGAQVNHPMHSDNRSIEGNHWAHFVGGASMARTKGFNVQQYGAS
jgi:hypothetical protein